MIWVGLLGLVLGGLLGYGIAYARFGDAAIVAELREQYRSLLGEHQALEHDLHEYKEQNRIVKYKAQQLLQQNEDYAKIVSQLSRYHYHLQQASEKVKELTDILGIHNDDFEKKLHAVEEQGPGSLRLEEFEQAMQLEQEKKFF